MFFYFVFLCWKIARKSWNLLFSFHHFQKFPTYFFRFTVPFSAFSKLLFIWLILFILFKCPLSSLIFFTSFTDFVVLITVICNSCNGVCRYPVLGNSESSFIIIYNPGIGNRIVSPAPSTNFRIPTRVLRMKRTNTNSILLVLNSFWQMNEFFDMLSMNEWERRRKSCNTQEKVSEYLKTVCKTTIHLHSKLMFLVGLVACEKWRKDERNSFFLTGSIKKMYFTNYYK